MRRGGARARFAAALWLAAALSLVACTGSDSRSASLPLSPRPESSTAALLDAGAPVGAASAPAPSTVPSAAPAAGLASASTSASSTSRAAASPPPARSLRVDERGPIRVVDLHVDTPWKVHFKERPRTNPEGPATAERLRLGRYAAVVYPIYLPDYLHDGHPTVADADAIFDTIDAIVAEDASLVSASGLPEPGLVPEDKVAVLVSIEGAGAFADDIAQIDRFIRRGVRFVGPVHARDNRLGGAATGKERGGLTDVGKAFCERVYAAGALVDVSHLSERGFRDLVPIAKRFGAPIVATHSNARAKKDHARNLTDKQLRVIAETGGVAGLNLHRGFLGGQKLSSIVAMVKHMVAVAGVEHVAIGSDFDGGTPPSGLADASTLPSLASALVAAGMTEADVRKIMATNALRVLEWRPSTVAP